MKFDQSTKIIIPGSESLHLLFIGNELPQLHPMKIGYRSGEISFQGTQTLKWRAEILILESSISDN